MQSTMKSYNKFDWFLFFLIFSLAFGMVGGALSLPRVISIVFLPFLISVLPNVNLRKYDLVVAFLLFWLAYGAFSLSWTSDRANGLVELVYYFVHFIIFLEIIFFSKFANKPLLFISMGWACGFVLTSMVGIWELATDSHLYMSVHHSELYYNSGSEFLRRRFASVTFGNYNGYVTYICFAFPFLLYLSSRKDYIKLLSIYGLCLSFIIVLYDASRGGFLSLCGMFLIYYLAINKFNFKILFLLLLVAAIVTYLKVSTDIFDMILLRTEKTSGTDETRFVLWSNVIKLWASDAFIGTGIGGMVESMKSFSTNRLLITHNLFFEILVQFGFVVVAPILLYLFCLVKKVITIQEKNRKWILISLFCMMPFYTIIHSGYMLFPPTFAFFASLQVMVDYEYT